MKRSALAHAPLQIKAKTKQEARFYARNVRRLMRGGGIEEEGARERRGEGGGGWAEGWRRRGQPTVAAAGAPLPTKPIA